MDELITKPLKRFLTNSKNYAKHHIGEIYGYSRDDTIRMADMKMVRSPKGVKYVSNYISNEIQDNTNNSGHVVFNDSFINQSEVSGITQTNNNIELVKVKLVKSPSKSVTFQENSMEEAETKLDKDFGNRDEEKNTKNIAMNAENDDKGRKAIVKVKIIVPKGYKNKEIDMEKIVPESEFLQSVLETTDDPNYDPEMEDVITENNCIFEENKLRPLSPIPIPDNSFPDVEKLVTFHEDQSNVSKKSISPVRHSVPIMGRAALLAKVQASKDQQTLNDSVIISELVRNRFVINTYESRTCKRSIKKPSRYGRIYKSLERRMQSDSENPFTDDMILQVQQSSPIKIADQMVSLNVTDTIRRNCTRQELEDNFLSVTEPVIQGNFEEYDEILEMKKALKIIPKDKPILNTDTLEKLKEINNVRTISINEQNEKETAEIEDNSTVERLDQGKNEEKQADKPILVTFKQTEVVQNPTIVDVTKPNVERPIFSIEDDLHLINEVGIPTKDKQNGYFKPKPTENVESNDLDTILHERESEITFSGCVSRQTSEETSTKLKTLSRQSSGEISRYSSQISRQISGHLQSRNSSRLSHNSSQTLSNDEGVVMPNNDDYHPIHQSLSRESSICSSESAIALQECSNSTCSNTTADIPSLPDMDDTPTSGGYFEDTATSTLKVNVSIQGEYRYQQECEMTPATEASYDMEEFLKKALGDEMEREERFDQPTPIKEDKKLVSPPKKILPEDSICTSDASDLVSKINSFQSTFYRSLTKKLRDMSHSLKSPSGRKANVASIEDDLNSLLPNNEQVNELVRQAAVQYETMKQISKALTLCRNTKEFSSSTEQAEGERLLLISIHKRQAILNEIRRLDYELEDTLTPCLEAGTVTISQISIPLKVPESPQLNRQQRQWYVCVLSQGPTVLATQAVAAEDGMIKFPEILTFAELPSDFAITLEVYSLTQRRGARNFSHESKFHLNKDSKSSHCPTPKSFIHKDKQAQKLLARYDDGIHTTSFKLNGTSKIRVFDIAKQGPLQLRKVPLSSNLSGNISMKLQSRVNIPIKHSGFLTVGCKIGGSISWNRRWSVLSGPSVQFWNYPCDEDDNECMDCIDLRKCVNARIECVDRTLCARPKTLLLETLKSQDNELERYYFCADSLSEMKTWESQLNKVISALRTWNDSCLN